MKKLPFGGFFVPYFTFFHIVMVIYDKPSIDK